MHGSRLKRSIALVLLCLVASGCAGNSTSRDTKPSATHIVYTRYPGDGRYEVWIANVDGSKKRHLTAGNSPRISPDGRWVAYRAGCKPFDTCRSLALIASSGGKSRVLAERGGADAQWSPDSKLVVFDNATRLVGIEVATGHRYNVTPATWQQSWGFSFSPSGDEIAYAVPRTGHCFGNDVDIYVVNVGGGTPRRLTTDGCSAYPVWGAGGIAFARLIQYRGWGRHEIWRINPDGTGRRTITGRLPARLLGQGVTGLVPIAWSDDGRRLLAGLQTEFGAVPFAVDPEHGTMRKIADFDSPDGLSHDGRYVLVSNFGVASDDEKRVAVVAYSGGLGRIIARRSAGASWNR